MSKITLKQLQAGLLKSAEEAPKFMAKTINVAGNRFLADVIKRTPVNKNDAAQTKGQLRRNWQKTSVTRKGRAVSIKVYNNTEYALYVELGHRLVGKFANSKGWVDGVFMMENTRLQMEAELKREVPNLLSTFINRNIEKARKT